MPRRIARLVLVLTSMTLCALPAGASASTGGWRPVRLARKVVVANLKRTAPDFNPSLGTVRCSGRMIVAHCTVKASVSNDDVVARVTFARHRDGTHLTYVDKLTFTAVMGGRTTIRTFYGNILS